MLRKFLSLFLLYSALAIMLGHNIIPHSHHDFEHNEVSHHHNDGHHHDNEQENESDDWVHFFSNLQHGAEGLTFLSSHNLADNFSRQFYTFTALHTSNFIFNQDIIEVWQNAPPFIADYYNPQNLLPFGLRAPPVSIV